MPKNIIGCAYISIATVVTICFLTIFIYYYYMRDNLFMYEDHKKICLDQARTIIHNKELWSEYSALLQKKYLYKNNKYKDIKKSVLLYSSNFYFKYGKNLNSRREKKYGKIIRSDIYVLKDRKIVAQFVDFYGSKKFIGNDIYYRCTDNYSYKYSLEPVTDE